ncbi:MAG: right-handed parallel beta-helix repeat-containing protein, partial [Elusimicrobiota bacterium]
NCAFADNLSGLGAKDGNSVLESCAFEKNVEAGIRAAGGTLTLNGTEISGTELECVELHGGRLLWNGGGTRGGSRGLRMTDGAVAELSGVHFLGSTGHGVEVVGARLSANGARIEDSGDAAVFAENAAVEMKICVFLDNRLGVESRDESPVLENCSFEGNSGAGVYATAEELRAGESRSWREFVLDGVLSTRALLPFAAAYRAAYALLVRFVQAWSWTEPGVSALYVYRSWVHDDWQAGTSDVDMILVAGGLEGAAGSAALAKFADVGRRLRRIFPFFGEFLVLEADDLQDYLRHGGFRARGLSAELKPLRGERPKPTPTEEGPADLEAFGESAHAYTRLMSLAWRGRPTAAHVFQTAKAAGDVLRCWTGPAPATAATLPRRRDFILSPDAAPLDRFAKAAGAVDAAESRRAYLELCAETLLILHRKSDGMLERHSESAPPSFSAVPAHGAAVDLRRRILDLAAARRRVGEALQGVAWDDLYRSYFILDDEAMDPERVAAALRGIDRLRREYAPPRTLPMLLSRRLWDLWSQSPYLECPTRWMEAPGSVAGAPVSANSELPSYAQFHWGCVAPRLHLNARVRRRLAAESFAAFRSGWRHTAAGSASLSSEYSRHYLTSRVIGLRLLVERGVELPFFHLDILRQAFRREFPQDAAEYDRVLRESSSLNGPDSLLRHYEWIDRQIRRSA